MKWVWRVVAVLVGIPVVCAGVLWAMGLRSNAGHSHAAVELNASPDQVWPWLERNDRLKQWVSWLVEVRDSPHPSGVGGRRTWVMNDPNNGGEAMEIPFTYTEFSPPARMVVETDMPGLMEGRAAYRLTDLGNGRTRLEADDQFHYRMWMARLMEPLITSRAEAKMRSDFARLKKLIDQNAAAR